MSASPRKVRERHDTGRKWTSHYSASLNSGPHLVSYPEPTCQPSARENISPNRSLQEEQPRAQPKPPRSAFMCFTDAKKEAFSSQTSSSKEELLKLVADEWRALNAKDRASWDEVARNDKVRFVKEKAEFQGPWNIPKRRAKKHPLAPKRPMSAFLKYSQKRRSTVKEKNPDMSNTDVSRLLGEMWRGADRSERAPYVEQEELERAQYKEDIKNWRTAQAKLDTSNCTSHQAVLHLEGAPSAPRKRRDYDSGMFRQQVAESQATSGALVKEKQQVDRRIFRSYSGSGHPAENTFCHDDHHRSYRASRPHPEIGRGHPVKSEPQGRRPYKSMEALSYKPGQIDRVSAGSPNMMRQAQPSMQHAPPYRIIPQQSQVQREHPHIPLRFSGSDTSLFDSFCDPEPPFNPRQTRPSSSHYFPDNFYQYP